MRWRSFPGRKLVVFECGAAQFGFFAVVRGGHRDTFVLGTTDSLAGRRGWARGPSPASGRVWAQRGALLGAAAREAGSVPAIGGRSRRIIGLIVEARSVCRSGRGDDLPQRECGDVSRRIRPDHPLLRPAGDGPRSALATIARCSRRRPGCRSQPRATCWSKAAISCRRWRRSAWVTRRWLST